MKLSLLNRVNFTYQKCFLIYDLEVLPLVVIAGLTLYGAPVAIWVIGFPAIALLPMNTFFAPTWRPLVLGGEGDP